MLYFWEKPSDNMFIFMDMPHSTQKLYWEFILKTLDNLSTLNLIQIQQYYMYVHIIGHDPSILNFCHADKEKLKKVTLDLRTGPMVLVMFMHCMFTYSKLQSLTPSLVESFTTFDCQLCYFYNFFTLFYTSFIKYH